MVKTTESKETFEWEITDGNIKASIESKNSEHTFKDFEVWKAADTIVNIQSEKTLREVHKAMGELINELDKKRNVGSMKTREEETKAIIDAADNFVPEKEAAELVGILA